MAAPAATAAVGHKIWKIVLRNNDNNAGSRFLSAFSRDLVSSSSADSEGKVAVAAATTTTTVAQGDKFGMDRCFTAADVSAYVKLCGDTNPIHSCDSAAQAAGFRGRVVHGMLYAGLFPAIIGSQFAGAVYVSQSLQFRTPLLVGEPVCAEVEVTGIRKLRHHYRVTFSTSCYKKGEESHALLCGEAVALLPIAGHDPAS